MLQPCGGALFEVCGLVKASSPLQRQSQQAASSRGGRANLFGFFRDRVLAQAGLGITGMHHPHSAVLSLSHHLI